MQIWVIREGTGREFDGIQGYQTPPPPPHKDLGVTRLVPHILGQIPALIQGDAAAQLHGEDARRRQLIHHPRHGEEGIVPEEIPWEWDGKHEDTPYGHPKPLLHPQTRVPPPPKSQPEGAGALGFPLIVAFPFQLLLQHFQGFLSKKAWKRNLGGKGRIWGGCPLEGFGGVVPPQCYLWGSQLTLRQRRAHPKQGHEVIHVAADAVGDPGILWEKRDVKEG